MGTAIPPMKSIAERIVERVIMALFSRCLRGGYHGKFPMWMRMCSPAMNQNTENRRVSRFISLLRLTLFVPGCVVVASLMLWAVGFKNRIFVAIWTI